MGGALTFNDNDDVQLKGASDGTLIGNVSNRLMTETTPSTTNDRTGSGSLTALDTTVAANTQGMTTIIFNTTGTWVGTVRAEGLVNSTWILLTSTDGSQSIFSTSTSNSQWILNCGGYSQVRLRMSLYTSGTASVEWNAGSGVHYVQAWNTNSASLIMRARLQDINANSLTSSAVGAARALDVNVVSAVGQFSYRNLTGNATTTVKSGAGTLHLITINNNTTGGTITIYDNTAGSGTKIATIQVGSPSGGLLSSSGNPGIGSSGVVDTIFSTGLTVVTAGSGNNDVTIFYI